MNGATWYNDPTGTAAKVTAVLGSLVALVAALAALFQWELDNVALEALAAAVGPVVVSMLALWAILRARQDAIAPTTSIIQQHRAIETGEVSVSSLSQRPSDSDVLAESIARALVIALSKLEEK